MIENFEIIKKRLIDPKIGNNRKNEKRGYINV